MTDLIWNRIGDLGASTYDVHQAFGNIYPSPSVRKLMYCFSANTGIFCPPPSCVDVIYESPLNLIDATMIRADGKSQVRQCWVFVQLIFCPCWPMNQLNKNPNIA